METKIDYVIEGNPAKGIVIEIKTIEKQRENEKYKIRLHLIEEEAFLF